ncbi:MAG: YcaQ family DNA glycosylase [Burkholderiales bacterium]|nr:YcaQ family DNA glycosylase [Burkholderiales bacterium]
MAAITLEHLRRHALARSLFTPTTLPRAIARLGFVQADPIRAPARAQDLTLRHRVDDYRAGDLEQRYPRLAVEEDFFVNYGFLPRATQRLMHPRSGTKAWPKARRLQAEAVLEFVRERGSVHPRDVDAHFQHGKARNWFGGSSNASTQLLDAMHYRGLLRVAGREGGVRLFAAMAAPETPPEPAVVFDALADVVIHKYAPLPERTLAELVLRIRYGAPQWAHLRQAALARAKARLPKQRIDGVTWYWPASEAPASRRHLRVQDEPRVCLLAPFDPIVWDRRRFELFWGWAYRFEAYTPPAKRQRGYYALPLLWRDEVIGWGNLAWREGRLDAELGYVAGRPPRERAFSAALENELARMRTFLTPRREPSRV